MSNYIKSRSNYILKKKHQKTDEGTVFYQDQLTVNGISEFSNVDGQIPIYRDGNFILTSRPSAGFTRSMTQRKYTNNSVSGDVWTSEVLESYPVDNDSSIDTVDIKFNYYSLREFSYYGSCVELINSSLKDIIDTFPAEIYVTEGPNGTGETVVYEHDGNQYQLGDEGFYFEVQNPFLVDIVTKRVALEMEDNKLNPIRHFSNDGYQNFELIKDKNVLSVTGWTSDARYLIDGTPFEGTDAEWEQLVLDGETKQCFFIGDETARVSIMAEDVRIDLRQYKLSDDRFVFLTTKDAVGYHIRPKKAIVEEWFEQLDRFEKILLPRDTSPVYTCKLEVLHRDEDTEMITSELKKFTFPMCDGGWNIGGNANQFMTYSQSLKQLALSYDDVFCDNLYKSMTHETVKNLDWSVEKFYNARNSDEDYVTPQQNIAKMIRLIAREFDEVKFYIDGLASMSMLNYNDSDANMPDYFLSDTLETDGWELKAPFTKTLSEWLEYDGQKLYRDIDTTEDNSFLSSFGGIEFEVNERENYAMIPCQNEEYVMIGGEKYMVAEDKTITVNGVVYPQVDIEGVKGYKIIVDIPYTVRYIEVDGQKFYVDEDNHSVTVIYKGKTSVYEVDEDQTEVTIDAGKIATYHVYSIIYDQQSISCDFKDGDSSMQLHIDRSGAAHQGVPTKSGYDVENPVVTVVDDTPAPYVQTTGWSNDYKVGAYREYIFDPLDSSNRIFLNYMDNNPMDDPSVTVQLSDGTYRSVRRGANGDEVIMSDTHVRPNSYISVQALAKSDCLLRKIYPERQQTIAGTLKYVSYDLETKNIVVESEAMVNSQFYLMADDYTVREKNGLSLLNLNKLSITRSYATSTTALFSRGVENEEVFPLRKFNDYSEEVNDLKSKGFPDYPSDELRQKHGQMATAYKFTAETLYETITGDPTGYISKELAKKMAGKPFLVTFMFGHTYPFYAQPMSPTWDETKPQNLSRVWGLDTTTIESTAKYWEHALQLQRIVRLTDEIIKSYPNYRKNLSSKYPIQIFKEEVNVTYTEEELDAAFTSDNILAGSIDYKKLTDQLWNSGIETSRCGFKKTAQGTFAAFLYNKAVDVLKKKIDDTEYYDGTGYGTGIDAFVKKHLSYTRNGSVMSWSDFYGGNVSLSDQDATGAEVLIGIMPKRTEDYVINWEGYFCALGKVHLNYSGYNREGDAQFGYDNNEWYGYIDPYQLHDNSNFIRFLSNTPLPYALSNSALTLTVRESVKEYTGNTYQHPYNIEMNVSTVGYAVTCQFTNQEGWFPEFIDAQPKLDMYDVRCVGSLIKDIEYDTYTNSFGRLLIPSEYDGNKAGILSANGRFVKVYAEREFWNDLYQSKTSLFMGGATELYNDTSYYSQPSIKYTAWQQVTQTREAKFDVVDLGWLYFNTDAELITLDDLGVKPYVYAKHDETVNYERPSSIKPLYFSEEDKEYKDENGVLLQSLAKGIYWLTDNGEHLVVSEEVTLPTYKDFELKYVKDEQRQESQPLVVPVLKEDKSIHTEDNYFPITECVHEDDTKYKIHREFSDDADYAFTPYDCTLSQYCGGYFYKKCCTKESANGLPFKVEPTKYVDYYGNKLWLCDCECGEELLQVTVNNEQWTAYTSAKTINIEGKYYDIKTENVTYYKISEYQSPKEWRSDDIMYRFYKNLRLNSRQILRRKGTIEGLESVLAIFGLKSKRWYDRLSEMQQDSYGYYDYEIKEYSCFTDKIEDLFDIRFGMGKIAYYNQQKTISHRNPDSQYNLYDGLPVKTVSFYKDEDGNITEDKYGDDLSIHLEYKKDLYPFFDNKKSYDGNMYFQMYGGWLPVYPFKFSKNDDVILPHMHDMVCEMKGLHTETLRNVRMVNTLPDLLEINKSSLIDNQIVEVYSLDKPYAVLNGGLYEIKTESYIILEPDGVKREKKCSYVSMFVDNGTVNCGSEMYTGDIYVSDPLQYCYTDENELEPFMHHYDLDEMRTGAEIRVFLFKYDENGNKVTVDAETESLKDGDELLCDAIVFDSVDTATFDTFQFDDNVYSHYFKLWDVVDADKLGGDGWEHLRLDDPEVVRIESIVDNYKGNNPHSDKFELYDNGLEYMERNAQLFKFALDNESFDRSGFGLNGLGEYEEEQESISKIGFGNITDVLGGCEKFSVTGDIINTRDNYNMYEDSKIHFFGNFYSNNAGKDNVFHSNAVADKVGLTDTIEMSDKKTLFYGFNPTYLKVDGSVYNLSNIPTVNSDKDLSSVFMYTRNSEDKNDWHTERIINNKVLDINFFTDDEYYSKNYLEKYKYIDDVILFYLQQVIPSTTIARINFGGQLSVVIKDGDMFEVGSDGVVTLKEVDCGTIKPEHIDDVRVVKLSNACD